MELVLLLMGLTLGCFVMYFILWPKVKQTIKLNKDIEEKNKILEQKNSEMFSIYEEMTQKIGKLNIIKAQLETEREQINNSINMLKAQANQSAETIYQQSYALMQEHLSQSAEQLSKEYQQAENNYWKEYLTTMEDAAQELAAALAQKSEEIRLVNEELASLRVKADAVIAAAKREEEKELQIDKYKILVSDLDLLEINRLREIAPYFRNPRILYKMIWEGYYRNATNDMLGRILESNTSIGIYKITNLKNQRVYIGQSVNLNTRLIDHIKAGLGIDTPNNILYAAMMKDGVENFSFEILETCGRSELNDRETFYIDFYHSQEYGYNMTKGGAKK